MVLLRNQLPLLGTPGVAEPQLWRAWLADRATRARFAAKVYLRGPAACWYWLGALDSGGHGHLRVGSRRAGTSWIVAAHVFAYQQAYGISRQRLLAGETVIRHTCDEASCQNPAHLQAGTRADNHAEYHTRRHRPGGPLADRRHAAGRAAALRAAILTAQPAGPAAVEAALAAAHHAGDPHAQQLALFPPP